MDGCLRIVQQCVISSSLPTMRNTNIQGCLSTSLLDQVLKCGSTHFVHPVLGRCLVHEEHNLQKHLGWHRKLGMQHIYACAIEGPTNQQALTSLLAGKLKVQEELSPTGCNAEEVTSIGRKVCSLFCIVSATVLHGILLYKLKVFHSCNSCNSPQSLFQIEC